MSIRINYTLLSSCAGLKVIWAQKRWNSPANSQDTLPDSHERGCKNQRAISPNLTCLMKDGCTLPGNQQAYGVEKALTTAQGLQHLISALYLLCHQ
jgi:hypothetical protein